MQQIAALYESVEVVNEDTGLFRDSMFQDMVELEGKRKAQLQEQMMTDKRYMVVDKESGEIFNINEDTHQYDQTIRKVSWSEYWDKVKEVNRLFLEAIEANDLPALTHLLRGDEFPVKINQKVNNVDE